MSRHRVTSTRPASILSRMGQGSILAAAIAAALILGSGVADSAASPAASDALREVRAYIAAHNRHDLAAVMAFYAEDASFVLNGGRPPVHGRSKIAELEAFDVAAGSRIRPAGLQARVEGEDKVVSVRRVVEHSGVFSAAGLGVVSSPGLDRAFVIRRGKFVLVAEPEFTPACRATLFQAASGTIAWLKSTGDARQTVLAPHEKLEVNASNIAVLVGAIRDWRSATGWKPEQRQIRLCAG